MDDSAEHALPSYDTFRSIMNATDLDAPFVEAGATLTAASSKATARRLRRTRQKLGMYRHDLMVAMRIVNSVEREMIQSEWENWLADENVRCEQVKYMVAEQGKGTAQDKASKGRSAAQKTMLRQFDEEKMESLRTWHQSYCGSCRADQDQLERISRERPMAG